MDRRFEVDKGSEEDKRLYLESVLDEEAFGEEIRSLQLAATVLKVSSFSSSSVSSSSSSSSSSASSVLPTALTSVREVEEEKEGKNNAEESGGTVEKE